VPAGKETVMRECRTMCLQSRWKRRIIGTIPYQVGKRLSQIRASRSLHTSPALRSPIACHGEANPLSVVTGVHTGLHTVDGTSLIMRSLPPCLQHIRAAFAHFWFPLRPHTCSLDRSCFTVFVHPASAPLYFLLHHGLGDRLLDSPAPACSGLRSPCGRCCEPVAIGCRAVGASTVSG